MRWPPNPHPARGGAAYDEDLHQALAKTRYKEMAWKDARRATYQELAWPECEQVFRAKRAGTAWRARAAAEDSTAC
jgi:hypothetical protein